MAHHQGDVLLCKIIKRNSFGNEHADKFMVSFNRTFLMGSRRVTVKNVSPLIALKIKFKSFWVGEFAAIIPQKKWHQFHKKDRRKFQIKAVKNIDYRLLIIGIPKKSKHEFSFLEVDGKKYLATFSAFHRIHFGNRKVRIFQTEVLKIFIVTSDTAAFIYLKGFLFLAFGITDFLRKVNITCIKKIVVNETVKSAFTDHDRIPVVDTNMVKRLSFV